MFEHRARNVHRRGLQPDADVQRASQRELDVGDPPRYSRTATAYLPAYLDSTARILSFVKARAEAVE